MTSETLKAAETNPRHHEVIKADFETNVWLRLELTTARAMRIRGPGWHGGLGMTTPRALNKMTIRPEVRSYAFGRQHTRLS